MTDTSTPTHLAAWTAIMGCSAVVLGAHEVTVDGSRSANQKWVLAGTIITMTLSFFALLASRMAVDKFAGNIERATAILCLGLWCGLLPVIMDPGNNIAQGSTTNFGGDGRAVLNANIYFFSWGAFIANLFIVGKLSQEAAGPRRFTQTPKKMVHWYMILAASIVVLWAATNFYRDYDDDADCSNASGDTEETCRRTGYAIFCGAFGAVVGICAILLSKCGCFSMLVEVVIAFVLLCLYGIGVGIITFKTGPGVEINNLYFFSWIACFMSAFLMQSTWTDFRSKGSESEEEAAGEEKGEDVKDIAEAEAEKEGSAKEEAQGEAEGEAQA